MWILNQISVFIQNKEYENAKRIKNIQNIFSSMFLGQRNQKLFFTYFLYIVCTFIKYFFNSFRVVLKRLVNYIAFKFLEIPIILATKVIYGIRLSLRPAK